MRKILCVIVLALGCSTALQAQVNNQLYVPIVGNYTASTVNPYSTTLDTVTDAGTDTFSVKMASHTINSLTFEVDATKISGDPSGVVVYFQVTAQPGTGTDFKTLFTDTVKNGANEPIIHVITGNPYTNYREVVVGSGTQSSSYKASVLIR